MEPTKYTLEELRDKYNLKLTDEDDRELFVLIMNGDFNRDFDSMDSNELHYIGTYYHHVEKNYDIMKKYYLMAINKGNTMAMYRLGYYYHFVEKKYDEMKKYYLMAINKDNTFAMCNMGYYYCNVEKNYDEMKKYYLWRLTKVIYWLCIIWVIIIIGLKRITMR